MTSKPKTIEEYLAALGDEQRAALEKLRKLIRAAVPKAQECISYGLPAFRLDQQPLVALGATTKHCAFYLMSGSVVERHQDELKGYDTSKGTIRFQPDKPLPTALVRKLVRARIAENRQSSPKQSTEDHVHYHRDGTVWAKGMTVQGVPTGYWEWFRKDGTRLRSGHFDNGKQVGEWITYDKQGQEYKVTQIKPKPATA